MFRVGILGAGHIAIKMANTLRAMEGAEAYAVASRDLGKARKFASDYGCGKAYGSYEELVSDPDVDLVYVATPHSLHYQHVRLCLEHDMPVLCEKAFMTNAREAEQVIRFSEERGIFLAEAIWTRYLPFQKTIREIAHSGVIGRPVLVTAHLGYPVSDKERVIRPELGGGALLDLGVYTLNFALMLLGDGIAEVSSSCVKAGSGIDLQESITLKYSTGELACLMSSAMCANEREGIICGGDGYIVCDNVNNPLKAMRYDRMHNLVETYCAPKQITGFEYQVLACERAINQGRIEPEEMPHSETLKVMRLMDALRKEWGVRFPSDDH